MKTIEDFAFELYPECNYIDPNSLITMLNGLRTHVNRELTKKGEVSIPGICNIKLSKGRISVSAASALKSYFKAYEEKP